MVVLDIGHRGLGEQPVARQLLCGEPSQRQLQRAEFQGLRAPRTWRRTRVPRDVPRRSGTRPRRRAESVGGVRHRQSELRIALPCDRAPPWSARRHRRAEDTAPSPGPVPSTARRSGAPHRPDRSSATDPTQWSTRGRNMTCPAIARASARRAAAPRSEQGCRHGPGGGSAAARRRERELLVVEAGRLDTCLATCLRTASTIGGGPQR